MEKKEIEQIARWAKEGFTLIEIMVVVGILGLLMAVLIPNVTGKMDEARALYYDEGQKNSSAVGNPVKELLELINTNAEEVYQRYHAGEPINQFLVCWPDRIIEVNFDFGWTVTEGMMSTAAGALKGGI